MSAPIFNIYHLTIMDDIPLPSQGSDCYYGFVICAKNEDDARKLAQTNGGNEVEICTNGDKYPEYLDKNIRHWFPFWTNKNKTSCEEIGISNKKNLLIIESSYVSE